MEGGRSGRASPRRETGISCRTSLDLIARLLSAGVRPESLSDGVCVQVFRHLHHRHFPPILSALWNPHLYGGSFTGRRLILQPD